MPYDDPMMPVVVFGVVGMIFFGALSLFTGYAAKLALQKERNEYNLSRIDLYVITVILAVGSLLALTYAVWNFGGLQ